MNGHADWDVVLVIKGTGKINKRLFTTIIDERMRNVLGKMQSAQPIDCVTCRMVGHFAGPVDEGLR